MQSFSPLKQVVQTANDCTLKDSLLTALEKFGKYAYVSVRSKTTSRHLKIQYLLTDNSKGRTGSIKYDIHTRTISHNRLFPVYDISNHRELKVILMAL
jgi:hypothetical protein